MDSFGQIEAFTQVVAQQSFSRAAERLGVTPSAVSRSVARLEQRLGVRLLLRTTRTLSMTEEGAAFHGRCLTLLADLEDAERSVSRARAAPRGTVRVDAPLALGEQVLAPALPDFLRRFPDVSVELSLRDQYIDPVGEGIDVALRMGPLRASGLVAKKIGRVRLVLAGAPSYFARYGYPLTPEDLARHHCLRYLLRGKPIPWPFRRPDGETISLNVTGRLCAGSGEVLRRAATAGAGLVYLFEYTLAADISAGNLEPVLGAFAPPATVVSAVHAGQSTPKVKAWIEFVAEVFDRSPFRAQRRAADDLQGKLASQGRLPALPAQRRGDGPE
jgi:DNA-binding transcriptional LysR family regulator